MAEQHQWGGVTATDIATRLAVMAASKQLGWPLGGLLGMALAGGGGGGAEHAFAELKADLAYISARMTEALQHVREISQQIQWLQLVLEAQPAADRIAAKFDTLSKLQQRHHRVATQLVADVLEPNNGVFVDLVTLHAVIIGQNPLDPGQVSLIALWLDKVSGNDNLVQGVNWVNTYFNCLAQIQLQGVILLVNALQAEQEDDLALQVVRTQADCMQQQIDLLHAMHRSFSREIPIYRGNSVRDGAPFGSDGHGILFGAPVSGFIDGNHEDFLCVSSDPAVNGTRVILNTVALGQVGAAQSVRVAGRPGILYAASQQLEYNQSSLVVSRFMQGQWTPQLIWPMPQDAAAPPVIMTFDDHFLVAGGGIVAATWDFTTWVVAQHPELRSPLALYAYDGKAYVVWLRGADQSISFAPLTLSRDGRLELDMANRAFLGPMRGLPQYTTYAVFNGRFCCINGMESRLGFAVDVLSWPLATIAAGGRLTGGVWRRATVAEAAGLTLCGFSGVLGLGEAFQLALFTGMTAIYFQESDRRLKIRAISSLGW